MAPLACGGSTFGQLLITGKNKGRKLAETYHVLVPFGGPGGLIGAALPEVFSVTRSELFNFSARVDMTTVGVEASGAGIFVADGDIRCPPLSQPEADLAVEKTGTIEINPTTGLVEYHWVIIITNYGPDDATNVQLVDSLGVEGVTTHEFTGEPPRSTQGGCTITSPSDLSCNLGTLPKGGSKAVVEIVSRVEEPLFARSIFNTVEVGAAESDPNLKNNMRTAFPVHGDIPERNPNATQEPASSPPTQMLVDV